MPAIVCTSAGSNAPATAHNESTDNGRDFPTGGSFAAAPGTAPGTSFHSPKERVETTKGWRSLAPTIWTSTELPRAATTAASESEKSGSPGSVKTTEVGARHGWGRNRRLCHHFPSQTNEGQPRGGAHVMLLPLQSQEKSKNQKKINLLDQTVI